jgi:hypothetical protein
MEIAVDVEVAPMGAVCQPDCAGSWELAGCSVIHSAQPLGLRPCRSLLAQYGDPINPLLGSCDIADGYQHYQPEQ